MPTLHGVDLSKSYRGRKVVDNVELEIAQGEVVGLLGPNGAGKTTTFYMIVGLARPDSGRVLLNDEEITDLDLHEIAGAQFTVDGKIEQRPISNSSMPIEKEPNCPYLARVERSLHADFPSSVPSATLARAGIKF